MREEVFGASAPDMDELLKLIGRKKQIVTPYDTSDSTRLVLAYTTAGATARSGTTLGKGTASIYYLADSGSDDKVITATGDADLTFYNLSGAAVEASKYLMLLRFGDVFVCNWEDC